MSFTPIPSVLSWFARLGPSGAEQNARVAVETKARADRLFAEIDQRALANGWAGPAAPEPAKLTKSA